MPRIASSGCARTSPTGRRSCASSRCAGVDKTAALEGSGALRKQIDELRVEAERLQRSGDLGAAWEILYGRIPALEGLDRGCRGGQAAVPPGRSRTRWFARRSDRRRRSPRWSRPWTGVPTGRLLEGKTAKLLRMEEIIGQRLVGQRAAVTAVSDAVRSAREPASPSRTAPTGSFLFLGPTGVGGTPSWPSPSRTSCSTTSGRWCTIDIVECVSRSPLGLAARRHAARLHRLRRGRAAAGGGPTQALLGRAPRRG